MESSHYTEGRNYALQITNDNIINWLKLIVKIYPIEGKLLKYINKKIKRAERLLERGKNLW